MVKFGWVSHRRWSRASSGSGTVTSAAAESSAHERRSQSRVAGSTPSGVKLTPNITSLRTRSGW